MLTKTEAIILQSRKFGDSSKILHVFTKDFGKLSVLAKGSRKPKNKFGGSLEPLSYSNLMFYKKPNRDLHLLSSSETCLPLRKVSSSFEHIATGLVIVESIANTQANNLENCELFNLATHTLSNLNKLPTNPYSLFIYFQIKLAENIGFGFHTEYNNSIASFANDKNFFIFSLEEASIVNINSIMSRNFIKIDQNAFHKLALIHNSELEDVGNIELNDYEKVNIHDFFVKYFSYHLERNFRYKSHSLFIL